MQWRHYYVTTVFPLQCCSWYHYSGIHTTFLPLIPHTTELSVVYWFLPLFYFLPLFLPLFFWWSIEMGTYNPSSTFRTYQIAIRNVTQTRQRERNATSTCVSYFLCPMLCSVSRARAELVFFLKPLEAQWYSRHTMAISFFYEQC